MAGYFTGTYSPFTGPGSVVPLIPPNDGKEDIGTSSKRYRTLYALDVSDGTNTTSTTDLVYNATPSSSTGDIATFSDTSGRNVGDSKVAIANVVKTTASTVTSGNFPAFGDTSGRVLIDSGVSDTSLTNVVLGPSFAVSGNVASFNGTSGKLIQDPALPVANIVHNAGGSSVVGDFVYFSLTDGRTVGDSGILFSNVLQNLGGVVTSGNVVIFSGTSGRGVTDSGLLYTNLVENAGGTVTSGNLSSFVGTAGRAITDAGILGTNVVQNSGGVVVSGDLASFSGTGGRSLVDSGLLATTLSGGPFVKNLYSLINNGSTPNFINNTTVQTSLVLTPPATQNGSLIFASNSTKAGTIIKMRGTTQFNLQSGNTFQLFIGNLTSAVYLGLPIYTAASTVSNIRVNIDAQIWLQGNGNAIVQCNTYFTDTAGTIKTFNGNNTGFWVTSVSNTLDLSGQFSVASTNNQAFQTTLDVTQQF